MGEDRLPRFWAHAEFASFSGSHTATPNCTRGRKRVDDVSIAAGEERHTGEPTVWTGTQTLDGFGPMAPAVHVGETRD